MKKQISVHNPFIKWGFVGIISLLWSNMFFMAYSDGSINWESVVHSAGELAWKLLLITVFLGLLCRLFPKNSIIRTALPFRKYTGIFAFLLAITHGVAHLIHTDVSPEFSQILNFFTNDISMAFGFLAVMAMLLPFLTSTVWAVKVMGPKLWKNIQRITHIAFVFVILHVLFLDYTKEGELEFEILVPFALYSAGYGYYFWKKYTHKKEKE